MTSIVTMGCKVAEVHHEYDSIHNTLFGATSFRLVIANMTGRTAKIYRTSQQSLEQLQLQLSELSAAIPSTKAGAAAHQADQLRVALSDYVLALDKAIVTLQDMFVRLLNDEDAYSTIPERGKSAFTLDRIRYDRVLMQLEQRGSDLNKLFSRF